MRLKVLASLGGTLVIKLEERLHLVSLVSLSRWKIASGTWTSWHEERSAKRSDEKRIFNNDDNEGEGHLHRWAPSSLLSWAPPCPCERPCVRDPM